MYKRGKVNQDWKQRTFVLDEKRLCYFKGGVSGTRMMRAASTVVRPGPVGEINCSV